MAKSSPSASWKRPSHDGALSCSLCSTTSAEAGHEWCAVAESLVCDRCCTALLHGDVMSLFTLSASVGRVVTPEGLFEICAGCERAHRHAREEMLEDAVGDDAPAC